MEGTEKTLGKSSSTIDFMKLFRAVGSISVSQNQGEKVYAYSSEYHNVDSSGTMHN